MAAKPQENTKTANKNAPSGKINPAAPAGSRNSLGEESVRDGRPASDDSIVEAIDEEDPATPGAPNE